MGCTEGLAETAHASAFEARLCVRRLAPNRRRETRETRGELGPKKKHLLGGLQLVTHASQAAKGPWQAGTLEEEEEEEEENLLRDAKAKSPPCVSRRRTVNSDRIRTGIRTEFGLNSD